MAISTDNTIILGQDPTRYKEIWLALHAKARCFEGELVLETCDPLDPLERKLYDTLTIAMQIDAGQCSTKEPND